MPRLVADRKGCSDRVRRLELSKLISRAVRCAKRRYCTAEATRILQEFRDLNRLNNAHNSTDFPSRDQQCLPDYFTELLESVYASRANCPMPYKDTIRQLPRFSLAELNKALIQMPSNRCADCFGMKSLNMATLVFIPSCFDWSMARLIKAQSTAIGRRSLAAIRLATYRDSSYFLRNMCSYVV